MAILWRSRSWRACALVLALAVPTVAAAQPTSSGNGRPEANRQAVGPTDPGGGPITLGEALALALSDNPRLSVFDLEVRVRDAQALQASLRPNPELALEVENFAGSGDFSGFGAAEVTLSVAQLFELGGKRAKRQELARVESALAVWDYEAVRLDVFNEVARAFVAVVAAQQQVALATDLIEVARQDLAAVNRRVEAGAASSIERSRAKVALATAQMDLEASGLALTAARAQLTATWGGDRPLFGSAIGSLDRIAAPPGLDQLVQRLEANPDIARWRTGIAQRRASLAVERALGKIDLVAAGGLRRSVESGDNAFVAGVALPLPFRNRNQGSVQAAELRLRQAEQERLTAVVATSAALATGHAEMDAAYRAAEALRNIVLPEAQEAMATAEGAYLKGLFSFTDVLAVRRTFYELRGRYIAALAGYHSASADIERLVAGSLSEADSEQEQP